MGKVPALTDGEVIVTENPAIWPFLADRYGYGRLAPTIEEPERGADLRWMVFSTAVFDRCARHPIQLPPAAAAGVIAPRSWACSGKRWRQGRGCWATTSPPLTPR